MLNYLETEQSGFEYQNAFANATTMRKCGFDLVTIFFFLSFYANVFKNLKTLK